MNERQKEADEEGPLIRDPRAGTDPTRSPTGSAPLAPETQTVDGPEHPESGE
jgi:hypothetical protein